MALQDRTVKNEWTPEKEKNIFDLNIRRSVSAIEMMKPIGNLYGKSLGEEIGQGGVLIDYGCGNGMLGECLSSRHSKILLQADVADERVGDVKSNPPFVQLDRLAPPDFDKTEWKLLSKSVDRILLADVLHKVVYSGMSSVESKMELLNRLSGLLTKDGKILVANNSPMARQYIDSGTVDKLQNIIATDEKLRDRVIFY